jgi:hypothetical protein
LNCEHDDQRQRIIEKQLRNIRAVWRSAGALLTMGHRYGSGTSRCILNTTRCGLPPALGAAADRPPGE